MSDLPETEYPDPAPIIILPDPAELEPIDPETESVSQPEGQ